MQSDGDVKTNYAVSHITNKNTNTYRVASLLENSKKDLQNY